MMHDLDAHHMQFLDGLSATHRKEFVCDKFQGLLTMGAIKSVGMTGTHSNH